MANKISNPPHGTRRRYQLRRDPCHCARCTAANTMYVRSRRGLVTWEEVELPLEDGEQ